MTVSTPTPGTTTPGTFLGREPLLWMNAARAVVYGCILLEFITLTEPQLVGVLAALEAVLYLITRTQTTPNVSVVERSLSGVVYAGPANETVVAGQVVRRIADDEDFVDTGYQTDENENG